jgi:hypothetical protein
MPRLLWILLPIALLLTGCGNARLVVPPPLPPLVEIVTPKTAAEQNVVDAQAEVDKARKGGDALTVLTAEQKYARAAAKLAFQQAKEWQQVDADKTKEITDERNARRQLFLYVLSGVVGLLAILAAVGAFAWPTARPIFRPVAIFLGLLVPALLFAAWLVPYLEWIAGGIGVIIIGVGGWFMADNERRHKLKDRTTEQVVEAVGDAKRQIPEFNNRYKDIFRGCIDTDVDQHLDLTRARLADDAQAAARKLLH